MGITVRLSSYFAAILAIFALMGGAAVIATSSINARISDIYQHPFAVSGAILEVQGDIRQLRLVMIDIAEARSASTVERSAVQAATLDRRIRSNLDTVAKYFLGSPALVATVAEEYRSWSRLREAIVEAGLSGDRARSTALIFGSDAMNFEKLDDAISEVVRFARRKAAEFSEEGDRAAGMVRDFLAVGFVAALMLGTTLAWRSTVEIARPLSSLARFMERAARDEENGAVPHIERSDELGSMARAVAVFMEHIRQRRRAERALTDALTDVENAAAVAKRSERDYRSLLESVTDYAIFRLDADGIVVSWNAGAQEVAGYTSNEIIGQHYSCFFTNEDRSSGLPDRILSAAKAEGRFEGEGWRTRRDGSRFWAGVVVNAIHDENGTLVGFAKVSRDITERRQAQKALRDARDELETRVAKRTRELESANLALLERERFAEMVLNSMGSEIAIIDESGVILKTNNRWSAFGERNGASPDFKWIGSNYFDVCRMSEASGDTDSGQVLVGLIDLLNGRREDFNFAYSCSSPDESRWFILRARPLIVSGRVLAVITHENVTELKKTQEAIRVSEQRMRLIADNLPGMLAMWDRDQRCAFANKAFEVWFGLSPERMIGRTAREVLGDEVYARSEAHIMGALSGKPQYFEQTLRIADGSVRQAQTAYIPDIDGDDVRGFFVLGSDVTDLRAAINAASEATAKLEEANRRLDELSRTDALLGISNRRDFDERLPAEWARAARARQPLSMLMMDVDYFKAFNDLHGHQAGDDCLRAVAFAVRGVTKRATDLLARYGGEEIVLVLPNTPVDGAAKVATEIHAAVAAASLAHGGSPVDRKVTLSIGLAGVVPDHERTADTLVAMADAALYQAKRSGRNRTCSV